MLVAFYLVMALSAGLARPAEGAGNRPSAAETVADAEQAVRDAQDRQALWTTAVEALQGARSALAKKDFAQAQRLAQIAIEQARLGIAQRSYPPLRY